MTHHHIRTLSLIFITASVVILFLNRPLKDRPLLQRRPVHRHFMCRSGDRRAGEHPGDPAGGLTPELLMTDTGGKYPAHLRLFHPFRERIDINTAPAALLKTLPGITPALAERLRQERELRGPFKTVDDLTRVRGLTAEKAARLRNLIRIGS
jgi:hypothetical protein